MSRKIIHLSPEQVGARLGFSAKAIVQRLKTRDGQPGEFGPHVLFVPFPVSPVRVRVKKPATGRPQPVKRLGVYRIPLDAVEAFEARCRVFRPLESGRSDGDAA